MHLLFRFCSTLLAGAVLLAVEVCAEETSVGSDEADLLAEVVRIVSERHLEAPSRMELGNTLSRLAWRAAGLEAPDDDGLLTDAILEDESRFHMWLQNLLFKTGQNGMEQALALRHQLVESLPGDCELVRAADFHVERQLAGNRYVGVGIRLGEREGVPTVTELVEDGPLDQAGGKAGDRIVFVDGRDVRSAAVRDVVDMLRGPEGSEVELHLARLEDGRVDRLQVRRGVVPFRALGTVSLSNDDKPVVAHTRLKLLQSSLVPELRKLERDLEPYRVRGLVLDFRGASGRDAHQARLLLDALIPGGEIGYVIRRSGVEKLMAGEDALFRKVALGIMVDESTSGPLEWVVESLRTHRGAIVAGEATAGNPRCQEGIDLADGETALVMPEAVLMVSAVTESGAGVPVQPVVPDVWLAQDTKKEILRGGGNCDQVLLDETIEAIRRNIWRGATVTR